MVAGSDGSSGDVKLTVSWGMPPPTTVPRGDTSKESCFAETIDNQVGDNEMGNFDRNADRMQEEEEDDEEVNPNFFPSLNMIGDQSLSSTISALSGAGMKKRERSNAKAVECLDLAGNTIQVFRSGMLASQAFNIQQGDISLCCRGLKYSAGGYRFKFHGDAEDKFESMRMRKGGYVGFEYGGGEDGSSKLLRSTRKSRNDTGLAPHQMQEFIDPKNIMKCIRDISVRRFKRALVQVGPLVVTKWIPVNNHAPDPTLQKLLPRFQDVNKKYMKKGKLKKAHLQMQANRFSYGTMDDFP